MIGKLKRIELDKKVSNVIHIYLVPMFRLLLNTWAEKSFVLAASVECCSHSSMRSINFGFLVFDVNCIFLSLHNSFSCGTVKSLSSSLRVLGSLFCFVSSLQWLFVKNVRGHEGEMYEGVGVRNSNALIVWKNKSRASIIVDQIMQSQAGASLPCINY